MTAELQFPGRRCRLQQLRFRPGENGDCRRPRDENTDRKYDIDITADARPRHVTVAMILQIQTFWQMFDLEHANAVTGQDIPKSARLRRIPSWQPCTTSNRHCCGSWITWKPTTRQQSGAWHYGSTARRQPDHFSGTDSNGKSLYVTNNYEILPSPFEIGTASATASMSTTIPTHWSMRRPIWPAIWQTGRFLRRNHSIRRHPKVASSLVARRRIPIAPTDMAVRCPGQRSKKLA